MNKIRVMFLFFATYTFVNVKAQLSTNEKPVSYGRELEMSVCHKNGNSIITMPPLDMAKIEREDKEDEEYDMPPRFGYSHRVNYSIDNSGTWYELPNGDMIWQLNIVCPGALSVNLCYDKFWLPEGGKFFVYSKDRKHRIGAFTSRNNKGDKDNVRGFATGLVYGSDVIVEYYQPKEVHEDAIISIEYVVHGYRYIEVVKRVTGVSGSCMVNVNCEEGDDWQNEKNAIAMIVVNGERVCTGSLINTTSLSQAPLFLTADHCLPDGISADTSPTLDYYSFYWNYEEPGCMNDSIEPIYYITSGATVISNNNVSDFALFRLTEDPSNLIGYIPSYLGWDCTGQSGEAGVCIHHPSGDVKNISTVASQPESVSMTSNGYENYWQVTWKETMNGHGVTAGGSSGSPLLNACHKVIGQLHSGLSDCNHLSSPDKYGKFSVSWIGNNNVRQSKRLDCWLDSLNTGLQTLEGLLIIPATSTMNADKRLYSNIRITSTGQLTIQSNVELMGNSRVIVESGGKLIIDGGTLSNANLLLKAGASLQIINDGIIETRNGFEAPIGAKVDIINGKIL